MDIATLAAAAAVLLATKGGESFAGEAGKRVWGGFSRLVGVAEARFRDDKSSQEALSSAQADPQDEERLQTLSTAIAGYAERDDEFRRAIIEQVDDAKLDENVGHVVIGLSGAAHVGKLTTFTAPIHGNVQF